MWHAVAGHCDAPGLGAVIAGGHRRKSTGGIDYTGGNILVEYT